MIDTNILSLLQLTALPNEQPVISLKTAWTSGGRTRTLVQRMVVSAIYRLLNCPRFYLWRGCDSFIKNFESTHSDVDMTTFVRAHYEWDEWIIVALLGSFVTYGEFIRETILVKDSKLAALTHGTGRRSLEQIFQYAVGMNTPVAFPKAELMNTNLEDLPGTKRVIMALPDSAGEILRYLEDKLDANMERINFEIVKFIQSTGRDDDMDEDELEMDPYGRLLPFLYAGDWNYKSSPSPRRLLSRYRNEKADYREIAHAMTIPSPQVNDATAKPKVLLSKLAMINAKIRSGSQYATLEQDLDNILKKL